MELNEKLERFKTKGDFRVYLQNDDFGILKYDSTKKRYVGRFGYIDLANMLKAIHGQIDFIKVEIC